jgi:hypothetical protein
MEIRNSRSLLIVHFYAFVTFSSLEANIVFITLLLNTFNLKYSLRARDQVTFKCKTTDEITDLSILSKFLGWKREHKKHFEMSSSKHSSKCILT